MTKNKETKYEYREEDLLRIIKDLFWMARRYAHGRHTYAPSMVRDAYKYLRRWYPDFDFKFWDVVIEPPKEGHGFIRDDWLDDTNVEEK